MVEQGTLWGSSDSKKFRVISVSEVEGHTWVYYRDELPGFDQSKSREYSCYVESFEQRFRQLPE